MKADRSQSLHRSPERHAGQAGRPDDELTDEDRRVAAQHHDTKLP